MNMNQELNFTRRETKKTQKRWKRKQGKKKEIYRNKHMQAPTATYPGAHILKQEEILLCIKLQAFHALSSNAINFQDHHD